MQVQTQFSIYLINKPGVLAAVAGALAKAKVNILALALMDSGEHGTLRIVCDDPDGARKVLAKTHDRWTETEILSLELTNEPGAFAQIARKLAEEHVNITYAYITGGAPGGHSTAVFKVADMKKAEKVLKATNKKAARQARDVKPAPNRKK